MDDIRDFEWGEGQKRKIAPDMQSESIRSMQWSNPDGQRHFFHIAGKFIQQNCVYLHYIFPSRK